MKVNGFEATYQIPARGGTTHDLHDILPRSNRPRYRMISLNLTSGEDPLNLDRIRAVLVRLEDTIIFGLIERAQFAHNPQMYQRGAFKELLDLGFKGSWLEWFLKETETFHGALGA